MRIHWRAERLDEDRGLDLQLSECLLRINGRIEIHGKSAGLVEAHYLFIEEPDSMAAFVELWDLDAETCAIYEEIFNYEQDQFRYPIPFHLETEPGILCIDHIALRPAFRGSGLGREVMREVVSSLADFRTGLVLLDFRPLQHRPGGYDIFDQEVRDLPWNRPEQDLVRLIRHFTDWGMEHLPGSRFMVASPRILTDDRALEWPPCPVFTE